MGEVQRAGRIANKLLKKFLKEFPNAVTVHWTVKTLGVYDEFESTHVGGTETPMSLTIPAIQEQDKIAYRYEKYGVNESTDLIFMIDVNFEIPDVDGIYKVPGDPKNYIKAGLHNDGNYGTGPGGVPLHAYKILHLRAP